MVHLFTGHDDKATRQINVLFGEAIKLVLCGISQDERVLNMLQTRSRVDCSPLGPLSDDQCEKIAGALPACDDLAAVCFGPGNCLSPRSIVALLDSLAGRVVPMELSIDNCCEFRKATLRLESICVRASWLPNALRVPGVQRVLAVVDSLEDCGLLLDALVEVIKPVEIRVAMPSHPDTFVLDSGKLTLDSVCAGADWLPTVCCRLSGPQLQSIHTRGARLRDLIADHLLQAARRANAEPPFELVADGQNFDPLADLRGRGLTDLDVPWLLRLLAAGRTVAASGNDFSHEGRLRLIACPTGHVELEPACGYKPVQDLNRAELLDLSGEEEAAALTEQQLRQLLDVLEASAAPAAAAGRPGRRPRCFRGRAAELVAAALRGLAAGKAARPRLCMLRPDGAKIDTMGFDLSNRRLTDDDLPWLLLRVAEAGTLDLSGNVFSPAARAELLRRARESGVSDVTIELATGLEPTAQVLAVRRLVLTSNCLSGKALGAKGAAALAPVLRELQDLEILELRDNQLGNAGLSALAPSLGKLSRLQHLGLGSNKIGDDAAEAVVQALRGLKQLRQLGLDFNMLGKAGAEALAPALSRLEHLENLWLFGNRFGPEAHAALGPTLARLEKRGCACQA